MDQHVNLLDIAKMDVKQYQLIGVNGSPSRVDLKVIEHLCDCSYC